METSDGFTPIVAIFYAVFHPIEGTKIINQVPENSINNTDKSLFNFNMIKNYIIPKPQLCNKLLSIKVGKYKVIGYPVNIQNEKYSRNSFNFNFCFVFPYSSETVSYELTIKRIGEMFKVLEEQNYLLSNLNPQFFIKLEKLNQINIINEIPGFKNFKRINLSSIESLINQIYQDLNNYSECCIPLDSSNSIDIKLFPILPSPLNLKAYQVPILLVNLSSLVDVNWDPTMIKILPYINGINSIKKISDLSDSDYLLTKQCIQHLMHYKCLQIIDIFLFSNIYAPTNNIDNFLKIPGLSERCQSYIVNYDSNSLPMKNTSVNASANASVNASVNASINASINASGNGSSANHTPTGININTAKSSYNTQQAQESISLSPNNQKEFNQVIRVPTKSLLFYLYRSLNQGQTIKQWYIQHKKHLKFIDIRRFINFGILNGLIYRVQSYPILNLIIKSIENNNDEINQLIDNFKSKLIATNINSINLKDSNGATTTKKHPGAIDIHGSAANIVHNSQHDSSLGTDNRRGDSNKYLKSIVNESNLKTNRRKISFNYDSQRPFKDIIDSDEEDAGNTDGGAIDDDEEEEENDDDDYDGERDSHNHYTRGGVPRASKSAEINQIPNISNDEFNDLLKLIKLLKGFQTIDSICTELCKSRLEIESMLNTLGSNGFINS